MRRKRTVMLLGFVCVLVLALSIPSFLVAKEKNREDRNSGNGCKLQGTWTGELPYPLAGGPDYYMLKFFVTYHGTGDNEGTEVTEWINPVQTPSVHRMLLEEPCEPE